MTCVTSSMHRDWRRSLNGSGIRVGFGARMGWPRVGGRGRTWHDVFDHRPLPLGSETVQSLAARDLTRMKRRELMHAAQRLRRARREARALAGARRGRSAPLGRAGDASARASPREGTR